MKKFLVVLLALLYGHIALGGGIEDIKKYEVQVLSKLVQDIVKEKHPRVYFIGVKPSEIKAFRRYTNIVVVNDPKEADFVFVRNLEKPLNIKKPAFALDTKSIKYCRYCIGVFTWKNGRPMLVIFKEAVSSMNIHLPKDYEYFMDSKKYVLSR